MKNWQSETGQYLSRLSVLNQILSDKPKISENIPKPPLDEVPSQVNTLIYKSLAAYSIGVLERTTETLSAITCLWKEGYIAEAASLSRTLFEIWGIANYLTVTLSKYRNDCNLEKLQKTVNKIHEGVRSEVLMPWGTPASEEPIHVLDTIRLLKKEFPKAMEVYEDLCESSHANQPRYFEWWTVGKFGNNWTNETVQKRGHILLSTTVEALEECVNGIKKTTEEGYELCNGLFEYK